MTTSNAFQMRVSVRLSNGSLQFQSAPALFNADQDVALGPSPGSVLARTTGTNVDLSALTTPGICTVQNLDDTNYVEVGIWDPSTNQFYPMLEVLPGEVWPMRLSQFLGEDIGTGAGTAPSATNKRLRLKAIGGNCQCNVLAFNK